MKTDFSNGRRRGFTLIEVIVATGILLIIVMMVGGLFSQASSVWDSGYVRAEGGMVARAIVGSIQRDLQTAVDGRAFDGLDFGKKPVKSGNGTIEFVAMAPIDKTVGSSGNAATRDRGFHLISYSLAKNKVTRTDEVLLPNGRDAATGRVKWRRDTARTAVIYGGSDGTEGAVGADAVSAENSSSFRIDDISLAFGEEEDSELRSGFEKSSNGDDHSDFENYVAWNERSDAKPWCRIRVRVVSQGSKTGLEVKSSGGGKGGSIVAR